MEHLCPLCNGMIEVSKYCRKCGNIMKDGGRIQDYYDDYSPYLGYTITDVMDGESDSVCQHIFTCPVCGDDYIECINKIFI